MRGTTWRSVAAGLGLLAWGCGGSAASADRARTADVEDSAPDVEPDSDTAERAGDVPGESTPAEPEAQCNDSTCFSCGEGLCPSGFYCDAQAGPACSWLPECAKEPTCECIRRVLGAGCACEVRAGGPHVDCQSGG